MTNEIKKGNEPNWLHLSSTEEVLWDGHQTAYSLIGGSIVGVILLAVGVIGTAYLVTVDFPESIPDIMKFAPLIVTLVGALYLFFMFLRWWLTRYVVTTEELYHRSGILSQNVQQMRITRIQNTTCNQSFLERILSFGDITIYTAGSDDYDFILENVPSPQNVNDQLTTQLGEIESAAGGTAVGRTSEENI